MAKEEETARPQLDNGFATTNWSLVLSAQHDADGGPALDRLCRRYWTPIYVYVRRSGLSPADAEDATQDFFAYILDRSWLRQTGEERGSFRGYLLALLRHFLANRRRVLGAQKRGGAQLVLPADRGEIERIATTELDPSVAYEQAWARCVTQAALELLAREQLNAGQTRRFQALRGHLTLPLPSAELERIAAALGEPRNRLTVYLHRLKRRYGELIRAEIVDTLSSPKEADAELRRLVEVLAPAA